MWLAEQGTGPAEVNVNLTNQWHLEELLRFVEHELAFRARPGTVPGWIRLVALESAPDWDAGRDGVPQAELDPDDPQALTYRDVRGSFSAVVGQRLRRRKYEPLVQEIARRLNCPAGRELVKARLPAQMGPWWVEYVHDDLVLLAEGRAAFGEAKSIYSVGPNLYGRLYEVYKSGGIPVGWWGSFPDDIRLTVVCPGSRADCSDPRGRGNADWT